VKFRKFSFPEQLLMNHLNEDRLTKRLTVGPNVCPSDRTPARQRAAYAND
jgi:hypothetical protein